MEGIFCCCLVEYVTSSYYFFKIVLNLIIFIRRIFLSTYFESIIFSLKYGPFVPEHPIFGSILIITN